MRLVVRPPWHRADVTDARFDVLGRAEGAVVVGVLAMRVVFVVQLLLSLRLGIAGATEPAVLLTLVVLMTGESVLFAAHLWRVRHLSGQSAAVDVLFIVVMVAAEPLYSATTDRVNTWVAWGYGAAAVASLSAGAGLRRPFQLALAAASLCGVYLAVSLPGSSPGMATTALINSVSLIGFVVATSVVVRFVRQMAFIAEEAQARAVASAKEAQLERHRTLLHDQATVLSWLSTSQPDQNLEAALRTQAARGASEIRAFLSADPDAPAAADVLRLMSNVISDAASDFSDVPITLNLDLVTGLRLDPSAASALSTALRTLLHNVRRHARATAVIIHGDYRDNGWEVTLLDDGVGFDPATTPLGYGLQVQAGEALRGANLQITVDSAPEEGTRAIITGQAVGRER